MPVTETKTLQDQLREVDADLADARDQRAALDRQLQASKDKIGRSGKSPKQLREDPDFKKGQELLAEVKAAGAEIEALTETKVGLLKLLGETGQVKDPTGSGDAPAGDGWRAAAHTLDLEHGVNRYQGRAVEFVRRPLASVDFTPTPEAPAREPSVTAPFFTLPQPRRFLYTVFPRVGLDAGDLSVSDYRQVGARKDGTATASTDKVNVADHGYADGDRVIFVALTGGAGLAKGTTYYVRDAAAGDFKVAATVGGAAVDITTNATALTVMNLEQQGRKVTGDVERDPLSTDEKARLDLGIAYVNDPLVQWAVVADNVPSKLFDAVPALEAFLKSELRWQIEQKIDTHAIAQVLAAGPLSGSTGADLIQKVRYGIAALAEVGATPTILALTPDDAAQLDLTQDGEDRYLFLNAGASGLWKLAIVEAPGIDAPTIVDPALTGVLYLGTGTVLADPYTGMTQNLVRVRLEVEGLLHIRNANGAFVIE